MRLALLPLLNVDIALAGLVLTGGDHPVPSVVDAGIDVPNDPSAERRHPLRLLAVGGGLGLMGAAGLRRRATATR